MLPMTQNMKQNTATEKMSRYRAKLRRQGLRPLQLWVPDTSAPGFVDAARQQSLLVSRSNAEGNEMDFIDALQADNFDLPES